MIRSGATSSGACAASEQGDLTVEDIMHAGLIGCPPETSLATVAWILADEDIHSVVVHGTVGAGQDGARRWRLVTALEVVRALAAGADDLTAETLATRSSVTVAPTDRLDRVICLMGRHDLTHILVVEDGSPVGIVSVLDVVRAVGRPAVSHDA